MLFDLLILKSVWLPITPYNFRLELNLLCQYFGKSEENSVLNLSINVSVERVNVIGVVW